MKDERAKDRIDIIERWLATTDQCVPVFAIRWLLGEYRRDHLDAARWRHVDKKKGFLPNTKDGMLDYSSGMYTFAICGSDFAAAVDAAIAKEKQ